MSVQKINPGTAILLLIMIVVASLRLITHLNHHLSPITNFTPIGAMALFGGMYFKGKLKPFIFPLFTLFLSDLAEAIQEPEKWLV